MSSEYEVESLLRDVYERMGWISYALAFGLVIAAPSVFLAVESTAWGLIAFGAWRGLLRFHQARFLVNYQNGLWRRDVFVMSSRQIPGTFERLYIGTGFKWSQRHTQRMDSIESNDRFGESSRWLGRLRTFEAHNAHRLGLRTILRLTASRRRWNPLAPAGEGGGNPALHGVGQPEHDEDIFLSKADRDGHIVVAGTTGVGKTRLLDVLTRQDIKAGETVIVIDPKGDGELFRNLYAEALACGREDDFVFMHLGFPDTSARYNAIGDFQRVTEVASRVSSQLSSEGNSQVFTEFVWLLVNLVARSLVALGERPVYEKILRYGEDLEPLALRYLEAHLEQTNHDEGRWRNAIDASINAQLQAADKQNKPPPEARVMQAKALLGYYARHEIHDSLAHSLITMLRYQPGYLAKLTASLIPLMEQLTTGKIGQLLSPDYLDPEDPRPIFSFDEVIRSGGIIYIGLDALSDSKVAHALGASMLADLTASMGSLYKFGADAGLPVTGRTRSICLHVDELSEAVGHQFTQLANKGRGAGLQITAYTQTFSDLVVGLGDEHKANQVLGNLGTQIMMRLADTRTAEVMTTKLKQVSVSQLTNLSSFQDSSDPDSEQDFGSRTESRQTSERIDKIHPSDLTALPRGEAFALLRGSQPYKLRFPLPAPADNVGIPDEFERIAATMTAAHGSVGALYTYVR